MQDEESKVMQDEESKHDIWVPRYQDNRRLEQFSNQSEIYVSNEYISRRNTRNFALIHTNQYKNKPTDTRKYHKISYQEQDCINEGCLELNLKHEQK